jgi:hypothetical protein
MICVCFFSVYENYFVVYVYIHSRFVENHPIQILEDGSSFLRWFCHSTGQLLNLYIEVILTHVPVHLRILVQGDDVDCLIDTCWIKDPDHALIP